METVAETQTVETPANLLKLQRKSENMLTTSQEPHFGEHPLMDAPIELQLAQERFERRQDRVIRDEGYGATEGALAITKDILPTVAEAVKAALADKGRRNAPSEGARNALSGMAPELIALCTISGMMHGIGQGLDLRRTALAVGNALSLELWAQALKDLDAKEAAKIERRARQRGSARVRKASAKAMAKRGGFSPLHTWSEKEKAHAGSWAIDIAMTSCSDVFAWEKGVDEVLLPTITPEALEVALRACREAVRRSPVWLPSAGAPRPWTGFQAGGPTDERMQRHVSLVRTRHPETAPIVNAAIASGQMQPTLDALNTIQGTAYTLNTRVLSVLKACVARGIDVKGIPSSKDIHVPSKEKLWEEMSEGERVVWKISAQAVTRANYSLLSDRIAFAEDLETAEQLGDLERFYTACNIDWRGRVYPLPHFNFQREDRVRGLFLFEHGEPIGEEGLYWLKVHLANCGDFEKVSKKPFAERAAWTDANLDRITAIADDPLAPSRLAVWTQADKPFLFLAACLELSEALRIGPAFVTRLPVSWDGSCSGLQHLCAMTRAEEGEFVNLTGSPTPQDVYQRVADAARVAIEYDAVHGAEKAQALAKLCLAYGVTRAVVKRNVMTYSYSSKRFGMSQQLVEDLMEPLTLDVLKGTLPEHPFGDDKGSAASKYLAGHIYAAIEQIVTRPAQAMAFLQKLAKCVAHENKPLTWVTPTGLPWINRYHECTFETLRLWLHDRGVRIQHQVRIANGYEKDINKTKAANSVAPNFVHALDAAHLMLTVNAAVAEGITSFALVHDSFGCLASRAGRFHGIIREQFVQMYETHDVLTQVLEQAKCALTVHNWQRLPDVVTAGNLNIKEVLNADYAFS